MPSDTAALLKSLYSKKSQNKMKNLKYIILLFGLAEIARADKKEKCISNKELGVLLILRVFLLLFETMGRFEYFKIWMIEAILGFFAGGGLFFLCYCVEQKALGAGDVKLMSVVGCYLGEDKVLWTAFFSVSYAAIYFLWKIFVKKEKTETQIAFAPFVFAGVVSVVFVYGKLL